MKVKYAHPWWLVFWLTRFGLRPNPGAVFTFGHTVYTTQSLPPDIIEHERIHIRQQDSLGPLGRYRWWYRYATDPGFRYEQETEAYGVQFRFISQRTNRRTALKFLYGFVDVLRSPMYGFANRTQKEVRESIQDWARYPSR